MTHSEVVNALSYLYLKKELERLEDQNRITKDERKTIENNLKIRLAVGKELCWI